MGENRHLRVSRFGTLSLSIGFYVADRTQTAAPDEASNGLRRGACSVASRSVQIVSCDTRRKSAPAQQ